MRTVRIVSFANHLIDRGKLAYIYYWWASVVNTVKPSSEVFVILSRRGGGWAP